MATENDPAAPGLWGRIRHICLDKDGTLTDVHSYWAHICGLRAAALVSRYGLAPTEAASLLGCMGIDPGSKRIRPGGPVGYWPRPVVAQRLVEHLERGGAQACEADVLAVFQDVDQRQQEQDDYRVELLCGVREALADMTRQGLVLSVYSSDRRENSLRVLERLALGACFKSVVGGGCVRRPKPHPEGFLLACRQVGIEPSRSAYLGDTVEDVKMSLAGGAAAALAVATGLSPYEELRALTPHVLRRLGDWRGAAEAVR